MLGRKGAALCLLVWASLTLLLPSVGLAADGGGYLAGYENQDPMPNGTPGVSWWSTIAYVASLVVVFLFVAGLAYYASKILGGRFGRAVSGVSSTVSIISALRTNSPFLCASDLNFVSLIIRPSFRRGSTDKESGRIPKE